MIELLKTKRLDAQPLERRTAPPQQIFYMTATSLPLVPSYLGVTFLAAMLLLGRFLNFDPARADGLASFDPNLLNESGRSHLRGVSRHRFIMLGWVIAGIVLITWMSVHNP